jgi:hypothetical protein
MKITGTNPNLFGNGYKPAVKTEKSFSDVLKDQITAAGTKAAGQTMIYPAVKKVESVYDIPQSQWHRTLDKAVQASKEIDTTGMTKAEILNKVESIFADHLGKDSLELYKIYAGFGGGSMYDCIIGFGVSINMYFGSALSNHEVYDIYDTKSYSKIHIEAKGFSGMSEVEMRAAIRSQYPENMTLKDCLLMAWDLNAVGLEENVGTLTTMHIYMSMAYGLFPPQPYGTGPNENAIMKNIFDAMLNRPASFDAMKANVATLKGSDGRYFSDFDYNSLFQFSLDEMLRFLLGCFGGDGLYDNDMIDELMGLLDKTRSDAGTISA